jgi:hypothetical protein
MFQANLTNLGLQCSICGALITPFENLTDSQQDAQRKFEKHLPELCKPCLIIQKDGTLVWIDDIRDPFTGSWIADFAPEFFACKKIVWVKSYEEFTRWIQYNGLPQKICFDHDLGENVAIELVASGVEKSKAREIKKLAKSGYDCAKWLVDYCLDNSLQLPNWSIQSANPVGKENINSLLTNAKKHLENII